MLVVIKGEKMVIIQNGKTIYEPVEVQYRKTCEMCKKVGKVRLGNSPKPKMLNVELKKETLEGIDIVI